jgi:hypothetical protein
VEKEEEEIKEGIVKMVEMVKEMKGVRWIQLVK